MKLKIIFALCIGLLLVGCQTPHGKHFAWRDPVIMDEQAPPPVRAAMLLPLSGKSASVGEAFRNSGMIALQEQSDSPLELMFFDTKGTPEGTVAAWQEARVQRPNLIIGPIFSAELEALKDESPSVPILSFTTDNTLMESGVYTLGVLIPDQVNRLVSHMCSAGQKKLAVLGPEDKTGELTMNVLSEAVQACPDMVLHKVSLYEPETTDFSPAVLKIVPKPVDSRKKNLTDEEKEILATPIEERIDFDALFIFEDGVKLQQLISLLAYYDVTPKVAPFYGLANWQSVADNGLVGGYFAAPPFNKADIFTTRYQNVFDQKPPRLSALAYDAVSLIAVLAKHQALTTSNLLKDEGFNGVNGRFRLRPDGTNERLLEVFQIQPRRRWTSVDPAPDSFDTPIYVDVPPAEFDYSEPEVF